MHLLCARPCSKQSTIIYSLSPHNNPMSRNNYYLGFTDESESQVIKKSAQMANKYLELHLNPRSPAVEFVLLVTELLWNLKAHTMFT